MKPLTRGGQINVHLATGHTITLTHRPDHNDYRVTVMKMAEHTEAPRHFVDEQPARAHARHLVQAYRRTPTEPFTYTIAA